MEAESKGEKSESGRWQHQVLSGESQWQKKTISLSSIIMGRTLKGLIIRLDILLGFYKDLFGSPEVSSIRLEGI